LLYVKIEELKKQRIGGNRQSDNKSTTSNSKHHHFWASYESFSLTA